MKVEFGGCIIAGELKRFDYGTYFGDSNLTTGLVQYNPSENSVYVDTRASDAYAKYAFIHESICCGEYKYLAPDVDDPDERCFAIDKEIIESIIDKKEREDYIKARIEMFTTLLTDKRFGGVGSKMFNKSLEGLKELQSKK